MSTKPKTLKEQVPGHEKELAKAVKRLRKKRRITRQIRISLGVAVRLKEYARTKNRTMSKVADELISKDLPHSKFRMDATLKEEAIRPFSASDVFKNL